MRIQIELQFTSHLTLPKFYNYMVQGFIYSLLNPFLRRFLHEEGYIYEKRKFKLFTFSRLFGKFVIENDSFKFSPPVKFIISSPREEILQNLTEGLFKKQHLNLNQKEVIIQSVNVFPKPSFNTCVEIKMLSPMTIYSTLSKSDGTKKTYYYSPFEQEFNMLLKENLKKKYKLIYGYLPKKFDFKITPLRVRPTDEKIIIYKNTVIKAWMGIYKLQGTKRILELAYDCGLGCKNSQGFGCFDVVEYREKSTN